MMSSLSPLRLLLLGTLPDGWVWPAPVDAWMHDDKCVITQATCVYDAAATLVTSRQRPAALLLHGVTRAVDVEPDVALLSRKLRIPIILTPAADETEAPAESAALAAESVEADGAVIYPWSVGMRLLEARLGGSDSPPRPAANNRENSKNGDSIVEVRREIPIGNGGNVHQMHEPSVYTSKERLSGDELETLLGPG